MTQSTEPRPRLDLSLLSALDQTNPAFIDAALSRGAFAECTACHRVLSVAVSRELAEMSAMANHAARRIGKEIRCMEHDHIEQAKSGDHK